LHDILHIYTFAPDFIVFKTKHSILFAVYNLSQNMY